MITNDVLRCLLAFGTKLCLNNCSTATRELIGKARGGGTVMWGSLGRGRAPSPTSRVRNHGPYQSFSRRGRHVHTTSTPTHTRVHSPFGFLPQEQKASEPVNAVRTVLCAITGHSMSFGALSFTNFLPTPHLFLSLPSQKVMPIRW